jgi:hypothetical protein
MFSVEATLDTIDLVEYVNGKIRTHKSSQTNYPNWRAANALVRSILITNMAEEVAIQMSHLRSAHEIWSEARRLFSGQTMTDFTLTITSLVTTKYVDGEDVAAHIAKMKGFRRDLMLMDRDLEDGLFACFLRISMPPSWNYVFAGLPQMYTSAEVERRIKDEHGIKANQESVATAFRAAQTNAKGHEHSHNSGDPYCTNCNKPGHWISGCWSKGGGAEGKGPRQKKKRPQKKNDAKDKEKKRKRKDHANQAVRDDDSDDESRSSHTTYMASSQSIFSSYQWLLDSAATTHICKVKSAFITFELKPGTIGGINNKAATLSILGRGDVRIISKVDGRDDETITLRNVAYCPDAADNLISEGRLDRKGMEICRKNGKVTVRKPDGTTVMQGRLEGMLYPLNVTIAPYSLYPTELAFSARYTESLDLWHRRFAHIYEDGLRYLVKHNLVIGLDLQTNGSLGPCDGCAKGKHPQAPFPTSYSRAKKILDRLHMDLQGPFDASIKGYRYVLAVVDDHSRLGWKKFLKLKSDASGEIKALITELENYTGRKVKIIRIDGGGEFADDELRDWFKSKGITLEISAPDTQQQNGVAERFNRTTHERGLSMLKEAGMTNGFWPEAHQYSNYARNRSPTKALTKTTPYEVFYKKKPDVSTLRIFGSRCHVRIPKDKRKKLDAHSIDGVFCGFADQHKAYNIWIPSRHKFVTSRDVIVYEKLPEHEIEPIITSASGEGVILSKSATSEADNQIVAENERPPAEPPPVVAETQTIPTVSLPSSPAPIPTRNLPNQSVPAQPRRSERTVRPSWRQAAVQTQKARDLETKAANKATRDARAERRELKAKAAAEAQVTPSEPSQPSQDLEVAHLAYMAAYGPETPLSYHDAIKSSQADEWHKAMKEEFNMLMERGTWVLEYLPEGRKSIGCRWTFVIKFGPNGEILRFKARLVAQGFSQIIGIDFNDTFAPTIRLDTLRALLHLAAAHGWFRGQDDVTGAFLHSYITEVIYMRQPQGFDDGSGRVCRLVRSLYGLRQAARCWNKLLHSELTKIGYHQAYSDNAVYVRLSANDDVTILAIHVDNVLSFGNTEAGLKLARNQLHKIFAMKEEDPSWVMGFQLIDNRAQRTISINHRQYIDAILRRFNMHECEPIDTPLDHAIVLSEKDCPATDEERAKMRNVPYRELVGALIWLSIVSRPDISFAATHLARFNANPGKTHWNSAKRVLRYLKGSRERQLTLGINSGNPNELTAYSDSDWGRDIDSRRSISGYVFLLGDSVIAWSSKQQPTVAVSATEGEYMSGSYATRQGLWLRRLLTEIGLELDDIPTTLFLDNRGAMDLSKEARHHQRTKHIDIHHHFIHERVEDRTFEIIHCPSELMLADGLTKPLPRDGFSKMVEGLGLLLY